MVKRYRNSPSIILWSMGNEEWTMMFQPQGVRVIDDMIARTHELDPTRLCTAAVNTAFDTHFPEELDVMGFNYNLKEHDAYHARASQTAERGIGNCKHGFDARHLLDRQVAELGERLRPEPYRLVGTGGGVVEVLRGARMAVRRLRLDRLRLSRRAHALWLAVDQFAVRHRRHVRISERQLLLLQSMVGIGTGAASVSALELGSARRRADSRVGAFESRFGRGVPERQEPGIAESCSRSRIWSGR